MLSKDSPKILFALLALSVSSHAAKLTERDYDRFALFDPFSICVSAQTIIRDAVPLPTPIVQSLPTYPVSVRKHGGAGVIKVHLTVTDRGRVKINRFTKTEVNEPELELAVRKAIEGWKFLPAERNGKKVSCELEYTFEFRFYP